MNRRKEKLQKCYDRCLELVLKHKIRSVVCIESNVAVLYCSSYIRHVLHYTLLCRHSPVLLLEYMVS